MQEPIFYHFSIFESVEGASLITLVRQSTVVAAWVPGGTIVAAWLPKEAIVAA